MNPNKFKEFFDSNKKLWNARTKIHINSSFYDMNSFRATKNSLNPIEIEGLGDIKGKRILHLQCHFGQDSMSMAEMGAEVTGIDISSESISTARNIAEELNISIEFHESNVYDVPTLNLSKFDIVFCSYGSICWLPDLSIWGEIIKNHLKDDGVFYMVDFHPVLYMYEWNKNELEYPYFSREKPFEDLEEFSYTDNQNTVGLTSYFWQHSIADILNACLKNNMQIKVYREYDWSPYNCFPNMERIEPNKYQYCVNGIVLPHLYELQCVMIP